VREVARFLVGIDFSAGSRRALAEARALARRSGAALTLAHVRPFSDIRAAVVEERGELVRAGGRSLSREIAAHYARPGREADGDRTLLLRGAPDLALSREARRGYALLVVGGCGHNAVSSVFLGSTAQRVLARSTIPVLVVPGRRRA
jgi:nucleotide-binding universal stress UspA family protein